MYNKDIKEKFIDDYLRSRVVAKTSLYSLFKKTEKYENMYNKDCCYFTQSEILDMYNDFQARSVYVLLNYNVVLKAYSSWIKYYYDSENKIAYSDISKNMLTSLVYKNANNILSRDEVTEIEEQLLNWTDKAIVEALFEGLSGRSMRDLTGVTCDAIDHKNKTLLLSNGNVFLLSDRLYWLICEALNETDYICYGKTLKVKKLIGTGKLYKERDNAHALDSDDKNFRWVYRKIQNIRNYVGIEYLTMKNLSIAGFLHHVQQGVMENNVDFKTFLKSDKGNKLMVKYGYNSKYSVDNIINRYGEMLCNDSDGREYKETN